MKKLFAPLALGLVFSVGGCGLLDVDNPNNVLDEDPPVCFPCGVIGLSTVAHDLPGRVGYLKVSYQR